MSNLNKIIKISSKEYFNELRKTWWIFFTQENKNIQVTNFFYNHISWNTVKREVREITKRLASINLIKGILKKWKLIETRIKPRIEWFYFKKSFKIQLEIESIIFNLVIAEKNNWKLILISIFTNK